MRTCARDAESIAARVISIFAKVAESATSAQGKTFIAKNVTCAETARLFAADAVDVIIVR